MVKKKKKSGRRNKDEDKQTLRAHNKEDEE